MSTTPQQKEPKPLTDGVEWPEGWTVVPLERCVENLDGKRVPVNSDERQTRVGTVPYYGATGQVGWIDDFLFNEELLLLGEDGAPFLDKNKPIGYIIAGKSWVNNHAHVLRAVEGLISNKFVKYFLDSFDFSDYVTGSTRLKLTQTAMNAIPVPLAPLPEQARVVARIEAVSSELTEAKKRIERTRALVKRFRQTVLAAACSGKLTEDWRRAQRHLEPIASLYARAQEMRAERYKRDCESAAKAGRRHPSDPRKSPRSGKPVVELPEFPSEWGLYPTQDLTYLVTDGTHKTPTYQDKGIAFLSVKNVRPFKILDDDVKRISEDEHEEINSRCSPEVGDILYTKVGATFGFAAINRLKYPFSLFVSVALLKPVQECFIPEYAEIVLNSDIVYRQATDRVSGSGTPDLHLIEIRDFRIPLPPVAEQREIVRRVEALFKLADAIQKRVAAATLRAERLTQAILAKAFRGELVPTEAELARREGREYEPASVLLERIKKEREKAESGANATPSRRRKAKARHHI